jgi:conjugative relaxase-like TrwC/TraI family protein
VTLSAPKSVSAVWALGDPWQREQIEAAHARAVEQTILYLREQVPVVRRRYGGQVVEEHARDVIAAEYRHTTARGVAGAQAPDPQLHSHVVITGAVREDGASSRSLPGRSFVAHGSWVRSTAPSSRTS